jgi:hypothetical protein
MELVAVIVHTIRWLNRISLKPLRTVIPDLDALVADPATVLQNEPIRIYAGRRYGNLLGITFPAIVLYWMCGGAGFLPQFHPALLNNGWAMTMVLLAWFGVPVLIGLLIRTAMDALGPELTISCEGALFRSHRVLVFCPWDLFDPTGVPARINPERAILPIDSTALDLVTIERNGDIAEGTNLSTRLVSFRQGYEIVLRGPYETDIGDVANLLFHIAIRLRNGDGQTGRTGLGAAYQENQRDLMASQEADGSRWIRFRQSAKS